jgi:mannose-1-phosphate guanylyltransferase
MNCTKSAQNSTSEELRKGEEIAGNYRHLWSIILAGGNGDRIKDLIHQWIGRPVPKQYCAFTGTRSMLQHTLQRSEMLSFREHQFVVIAEAHKREAELQLSDRWPKNVIMQPENRDTLPGIMLPLTHVYALDSKATIAIYPSDHFIYPEESFVQTMARAVQAVEAMPHMLLLIGAPADSLELDYGWICPGRQIWESGKHSVQSVKQFLEKPSRAHAAVARACGGTWNTLIMVAKAQTLWNLGCQYSPDVMRYFERLLDAIGTSSERTTLESIYEVMPKRNFSSSLLTDAVDHIGVMNMDEILWSDWGRGERILKTLHYLGKRPNFPMVLASGDRGANQVLKSPMRCDESTINIPLPADLQSLRAS